jgi:hypothetical protein
MNIYQSIIAAAVPRPCVGQAQSNKDLKNLQKRCRKQADEFFQRRRPPETFTVSFSFQPL